VAQLDDCESYFSGRNCHLLGCSRLRMAQSLGPDSNKSISGRRPQYERMSTNLFAMGVCAGTSGRFVSAECADLDGQGPHRHSADIRAHISGCAQMSIVANKSAAGPPRPSADAIWNSASYAGVSCRRYRDLDSLRRTSMLVSARNGWTLMVARLPPACLIVDGVYRHGYRTDIRYRL
jgi:hypothetical protein